MCEALDQPQVLGIEYVALFIIPLLSCLTVVDLGNLHSFFNGCVALLILYFIFLEL